MKPFWNKPFTILKFFTVPSLIFCNVQAILMVSYYQKIGDSMFWYALVWIALQICSTTSFYTAVTCFYASKADDRIGATYMATFWTSKYEFKNY